MKSQQIVEKFKKFYQDRGHKVIPNVSLLPENDPTLLFVNSGMFPLVPYLSGESHPLGKRLVNVQRSLRLDDFENVGVTNRHTIAFHMLGNWSLGDYFKEEQLNWVYELYIDELGLDPTKLYASVFEGNKSAPKDHASIEILKKVFAKYGIEAKVGERIFTYGEAENWWKRGDAVGELGGPDSEIFYYVGKDGNGLGKNPAHNQDEFLEIGNNVFMQYKKSQDGWEELSQKNVDFGGGLERLALAVQGKSDIFETDNFWPVIKAVQNISGIKYRESAQVTKSMRIICDHIRAATMLSMDGVVPSNKDQGYILRRIIRRMTNEGRKLGIEKVSSSLVHIVTENLDWLYPDLAEKTPEIKKLLQNEEQIFAKTLKSGLKYVQKSIKKMSGDTSTQETAQNAANEAAKAFQSLGVPVEIFRDLLIENDVLANKELLNLFDTEIEKITKQHQETSRKGSEQKFKGGLADTSEQTIKYHTATHVLHWALREILGEKVQQKGSNITAERLRFDFFCSESPTKEQLDKIQDLINEKVSSNIPMKFEVMKKEDAEKTGALSFFGEKYGDKVKVYYLGDDLKSAFSKEFCGGPHVQNLNEIGELEIYKDKSIGNNLHRVYLREIN